MIFRSFEIYAAYLTLNFIFGLSNGFCSLFYKGQINLMSVYKNFVEDFPNRCWQVLDVFYERAKNLSGCSEVNDGREITLLIMTASAGFIVPFERLKPDKQNEHIAQDRKKYPNIAKKIDEFIKPPFIETEIFTSSKKSWAHGKFEKNNREPLNDCNEVDDTKEVGKQIQVVCIISTIRNALAHGSIYTKNNNNENENEIDEIIFISEIRGFSDKYRFVKVSPNDFKIFLEKWFAFLRSVKDNPSLVVQELAEFAEKDK